MINVLVIGTGWCAWFEKDNDIYDSFLDKINIIRAKQGFTFEKICMDGEAENYTFIKNAKSLEWKIIVTPEKTPRDTP